MMRLGWSHYQVKVMQEYQKLWWCLKLFIRNNFNTKYNRIFPITSRKSVLVMSRNQNSPQCRHNTHHRYSIMCQSHSKTHLDPHSSAWISSCEPISKLMTNAADPYWTTPPPPPGPTGGVFHLRPLEGRKTCTTWEFSNAQHLQIAFNKDNVIKITSFPRFYAPPGRFKA